MYDQFFSVYSYIDIDDNVGNNSFSWIDEVILFVRDKVIHFLNALFCKVFFLASTIFSTFGTFLKMMY
jgi:hypothetical protein